MSVRSGALQRPQSRGSSYSGSSNEDQLRFWLPSLSSKSSQSSASSDRRAARAAIPRPQDMPLPHGIQAAALASEALGMPTLSGTTLWAALAPESALCSWRADSGSDLAICSNLPGPGAAWSTPSASSSRAVLHRSDQEGNVPDSQSLMDQVPLNEKGKFSSIGSIRHKYGDCSPCLFWFRNCCAKGIHCDYCHIRHKGQKNKRIRPSKKTRMQMRTGNADVAVDNDPSGSATASDNDNDNAEDLPADARTPKYYGGVGDAPRKILVHL